MNWREQPPTDKQITAIHNMSSALAIPAKVPKNKGEASDIISELSKTITNNLQIIGKIRPGVYDLDDGRDEYDEYGDIVRDPMEDVFSDIF